MYNSKHGFSLIELSIAMAVVAILTSSIVPLTIRSLEIKAAEKTASEISMIQEASRNYFLDHHAWPTDPEKWLQTLKDNNYLNPNWNAINPWQHPYEITTNPTLSITSDLTKDSLAQMVANRLAGSSIEDNIVRSPISLERNVNSLPTGTIIPWPSQNLPSGFLWCNGQEIDRINYADLFAVISTQYGSGNGSSTFNVPDLMGRTIVGVDRMGGTSAANRISSWSSAPATMGGNFGEDKHQLTIDEMPSHHHAGYGELFYNEAPWGVAWEYGAGHLGDGHSDRDNYYFNTSSTGGDQAHNIVQPSMALGYIIKY